MNTFYTILTDAGISTIISARANESEIKLSKMAVGDGEILPSSDMTSLLSEKYRFDIRSMTQDRVNPNHLIVEGVIPIDIGGFDISEIAIYTEDGTLFAIGNLPKTYKPQPEEGSAKELTIQVITEVANVDSVNISVVTSDLGVFKSEVETIKSEVDTITTTLDTKVDKVEGKGLSSNDFTDEYKNKLTNLSSNFKTINNESILGEGNIELIGSAHRSWYLEKTNSAFSLANTASTVINLSNIVSGDVELSQGGSFVIQEDGTYLVNFWTRVDNASSNLSLRAVIIINNIEKQFALAYHVAGGGDAGVDGSSVYEFKKGDIISFRLYQYGSTLNFPTGNVSAKITSINTQNALSLANYYSKEEVDTKINEIETGSTDLSDYYTKEQVNSNLETKQDLLLSGENLSTINGQSLLNGGDIIINATNLDGLEDVNKIITTDNSYSILNNKLIVEGEPITKIFKDNVEFDSVRDNYIWKENDVVFLENVANSWFDIDYYIAPDGDDTNGDGSYDNPWKTFANVPLNCIAGLKAGQYKTSSYGYYATNGNFNSTHGLFKGLMKVEHAHAETRPANANPIMTDSNLKALLATKNSGYNNYTKATLIVSENKDALVEIIYDTNSSQRDKGIFTNMGLGNDLFVFKNLTFRRLTNGGTNYSNAILRADSPITGLLIEECIFDFAGQPYSYNYIPGGAWVPIYNRCKFNGSLQANYSGTQVIINDSTINCINYFDGTHPINCYKYIDGEFVIYNNSKLLETIQDLLTYNISLTKTASNSTIHGVNDFTPNVNAIIEGDTRLDNSNGFTAYVDGVYSLDYSFTYHNGNMQWADFYYLKNGVKTLIVNIRVDKSYSGIITIPCNTGDKITFFFDYIGIGSNDDTTYSNIKLTLSVNVDTLMDIQNQIDSKQDTLVSGTNLSTINGQSLLNGGDITIESLSNYYNKYEVREMLNSLGYTGGAIPDVNYLAKSSNLVTNLGNTVIDLPINQYIEGNDVYSTDGGFKSYYDGLYIVDLTGFIVHGAYAEYTDYIQINILVNGVSVDNYRSIYRPFGTSAPTRYNWEFSHIFNLELKKDDIVTVTYEASGSGSSFALFKCDWRNVVFKLTQDISELNLENYYNMTEVDLLLNAKPNTDSLITINNQPLVGGGNIQVAKDTALINMGVRSYYYKNFVVSPNVASGYILPIFLYKDTITNSLDVDSFIPGDNTKLILKSGRTYSLYAAISSFNGGENCVFVCNINSINKGTLVATEDFYFAPATNYRNKDVNITITPPEDCYLTIVTSATNTGTNTTVDISVVEYTRSADGVIDLNNLSTLSSPKLGEEVLTEYRHPVSEKPLYSKYLLIGNTNTTGITNSYNWNSYVTDLEDVDSTRTIITLYNTTLVTYYTLPVYDINGDGVYTGLSNTSIWFRAKGTTFLNMPVYAMLYYTKTTDTSDSPVRLVGSAQNIYKLNEEIKTNDIWISRKPIYRKTIDFGNLPNNTEKRVLTNLTDIEDCWIDMNNSYFIGDNNRNYPLMLSSSDTGSIYSSVDHNGSAINITTVMNRTGWKAIVTINYTKTTDEVAN